MSDNEAAPIAWTWTGSDGHPAIVARVGVTQSLQHPKMRPVSAVPLVPATETQLPALDTPEALRYAADVVARFRDDDDGIAYGMRVQADRDEAAARVDAEREARIEKLALALHEKQLYVWGEKWEFLLPSDKAAIFKSARDLDDLGYRLDPTQAKATT